MALTNNDLGKVEEIVQRIVQASEERVVARVNREVTDLAEVNQAVLNEISGPTGMKASIVRIEKHLELAPLKH